VIGSARGRWLRFVLLLAATAILLSPVLVTVWRAFAPEGIGSNWSAALPAALGSFLGVFQNPTIATWFTNSTMVTAATVVVTVIVAAPAGYVLSRGRGRGVTAFALSIFALQALPIVLFLVPLFVIFAGLGLVDNLVGLTIVYIGLAVAVAVWTMGTAFDSIPVELEEAAWLDGCGLFRGFLRVVLPNALPGVLSTAVFTFLLAWNDYWIAVVFIRSDPNYTVGIGLSSMGGWPALSVVAMLPPVVVFAIFHRYFSFGGVSGALAGT
jgi:multiple sugar transport system permease protein